MGQHEALDQASVLLPKNPWVDGAYDLSVILSLLTGRHVRIGNDVEPYLTVSAGLALTSKNFFRTHPVIDWSLLPVLQAAGAGEAMEAVMLATSEAKLARGGPKALPAHNYFLGASLALARELREHFAHLSQGFNQ